jgi:hypothetical protein
VIKGSKTSGIRDHGHHVDMTESVTIAENVAVVIEVAKSATVMTANVVMSVTAGTTDATIVTAETIARDVKTVTNVMVGTVTTAIVTAAAAQDRPALRMADTVTNTAKKLCA